MNFTYSGIKVGDSASFEKTITDADILLFAAVSGDNNQIHINEEYAKTTKFGRKIAHGLISASFISAALTVAFPGSVYVSQTLEFKVPVYAGDTIKAVVTCIEKMEKGRVKLRTSCYNQKGELVLDGEGVTRLKKEES